MNHVGFHIQDTHKRVHLKLEHKRAQKMYALETIINVLCYKLNSLNVVSHLSSAFYIGLSWQCLYMGKLMIKLLED